MADRTADNADLAVDELKRKARRRLIGAIVLALAAAIILPLLLEKESRPLGDEVSVQIPPVDEGKFINRLTGRSGDAKSATKSDAKPDAANGSSANAPTADGGQLAPATAPTVTPTVASGKTASTTSDVAPPKKSLAEAEKRVLSPAQKPAGKPEPKSAPEAKADANAAVPAVANVPSEPEPGPGVAAPIQEQAVTPAAVPAKADGFVVQLAAFADDKGANALAGKLRRAGHATAYVEPVETSRGTLWRVRVGGFGSRPDAEAARAKLKSEGYAGIVAAAK
jgi:DedD protein